MTDQPGHRQTDCWEALDTQLRVEISQANIIYLYTLLVNYW